MKNLGVKTFFIEPGSPCKNGYIKSFNGELREGLLNRGVFYTLTEAKTFIEMWRKEYNETRPHSALGYQPRTREATMVSILN